MAIPTLSASLDKGVYLLDETMTLTVTYGDEDTQTIKVTLVIEDASGNMAEPVSVTAPIDPLFVTVQDSTNYWTPVSDTGRVAVYQAKAKDSGELTVYVEDRSQNISEVTVQYAVEIPTKSVAGGYYIGNNADVRPDTVDRGMNLKGLTQYRSFADGSIFPGWQRDWIKTLMTDYGVWPNYVLELKHYGAAAGPQTFTVDGVSYTVPAPNMTIQQKAGTTWPKAYGYNQVVSGQCDGLLARAVSQLKKMPAGKINIQLASEFDTDHEFGITEDGVAYTWAQADAKALAAVRYIIAFFRSRGISQDVTFTVGMAGQWNRGAFKRMHPEDLPVDYIQFNVYNHGESKSADFRFRNTVQWIKEDLGPRMKSLDMIVAEWGTNANWTGGQSAYINTVPAVIQKINEEQAAAKLGQFVMLNYFSSRDRTWGLLDPKDAGLAALKNIYGMKPFGSGQTVKATQSKLKMVVDNLFRKP